MSKFITATSANPVRDLVDAADLLTEARLIASFVHSFGIGSKELQFDEDQTSGFCIVMRDMMNRAEKSEKLIESVIDSLKGSREGE